MIPKIIHCCWLSSNPIPETLQAYMASWKKFLPDYELILWNFERFPKSQSKWVSDAFDKKKYAFAADYIRIYALYNYGGIYLDMDVEVLKSFDEFLSLPTMLGHENNTKLMSLEVAVFGVEKHSAWIKDCLDHYNQREFVNTDGSFNDQPLPGVIKKILETKGYTFKDVDNLIDAQNAMEREIPIFHSDFFSPKDHVTGKYKVTPNTHSIHHFAGSWLPRYQQVEAKFWHMLGLRDMRIMLRIKNLFLYSSIKSVPAKSRKNKVM